MASEDIPSTPEGDVPFRAEAEERLVGRLPHAPRSARAWFLLVLGLVLLAHAGLIALFLLRDRQDGIQVAQNEEVPVEVVVEKPAEPPPPVPPPPPPPPEKKPPPPPPPPPKEDLSPAYSAPRKENQETVKTDKLQEKTQAPKTATPPQDGTPQPKAAAAPEKQAAPATPAKEETASKEQDDPSKPDAEALDKATRKTPKPPSPQPPKTKAAKAAPKPNRSTKDLFASLGGASALPDLNFAKPSARTKVYGGTEDVRWMSTVEGMLEEKVGKLPRTEHWQAGGQVVICFHVDENGKVTIKDYCHKSGYPDVDQIAMRALMAAQPFPPPPRGVEHGLAWSSVFDGQLPRAHVSKR